MFMSQRINLLPCSHINAKPFCFLFPLRLYHGPDDSNEPE